MNTTGHDQPAEPETGQTSMPFTDTAGPALRSRIIADLRALADFLAENPELPVSQHTTLDVTYFPHTATDEEAFDEVAHVGALLKRIPAWEGDHYVVEHSCGAARYRAVAIPERVRAAHRAWVTYTGHVRPD
ncbi:hypothetical protein ACOQFV_30595 [Nocardiopsis changdeensis]|uniref:Uncharacterized protein n=1 Tax=Nocardiopsis changdeensis TaxID=2831969 RepID=A0ABX8BPK1_9ACTN|nr:MULTISPECIES: hypothetical protein [Nocardiopsis]QUX24170.1 hypothetical protein KGD84_07670 [Nocardiopsis changdeensis]QYX34565.1 hypothetical protein K1J57_17130 [Nocardiopsis sp. MT53]